MLRMDPETFCETCSFIMINQPAEQERLANNARELVVNRYDWKSVLKELNQYLSIEVNVYAKIWQLVNR